MKKETKIKYFLYARKSTEGEDRQILSIPAQISELKAVALREGIEIGLVFEESRSAKTLGRPVFADMLGRIAKGEAQGILCWKLDRLARNMVDGGSVINMLQMGVIQHIRTFEKNYYPQDNVLLMAVEFGMANQFSRDLAVNVSRGMRAKAHAGWYAVRAPIGYLNSKIKERGENDILKDPDRFDLVRKVWDMMLTGAYTPPKLMEIATKELGLWSRPTKKFPKPRPLSRSNIYNILTNPFYYGGYYWCGHWCDGKHEPMITVEEFDKVQALLGKKGRPRPKKHNFAFAGTMRCGVCGMVIVAEEKLKPQKDGSVHRHLYYHCSKRSMQVKCKQPSIKETDILSQGLQKLGEINIPDEFHKWALKWLEGENTKEIGTREVTLSAQRKAYDYAVQKLDRLIEMRTREELTEEEFRDKKEETIREKGRLQSQLNDTDSRITHWADNMESAFMFVAKAKDEFANGSPTKQRAILLALGSNLTLVDKIISIHWEETLLPMKSIAAKAQSINEALEPAKKPMEQRDFDEIYSQNQDLCAQLDSNQRPSP